MTARVRTLYTPFYTRQVFAGFCSKCQSVIAGESYTLGTDVWQDGVLAKTRIRKGCENICLNCFKPLKGRFQEKKEL